MEINYEIDKFFIFKWYYNVLSNICTQFCFLKLNVKWVHLIRAEMFPIREMYHVVSG